MTIKELLKVVDPEMCGEAWLNFVDGDFTLMFKINSCSRYLEPYYESKIEYLGTAAENEFNIILEDDLT